jgi:hypothetical protein
MAESHLPITLQYIQALGPTSVAIAVAMIASLIQFNQWKTAKDKLRIDLYDRRIAAFHVVDNFVLKIQRDPNDAAAISAMQKLLREARFLFYDKTHERLDGLYLDYINIVHDIRDSNGAKASEILKSTHAKNDIFEIFRDWLSLGRIR